ncbi:MAG TPA: hypothetical protein VMW56_24435 [Candidatus Margulisiibacteriota bacterium]|nr:hypothetical protein [Candidatus Margulisiibacteriota bacterium]
MPTRAIAHPPFWRAFEALLIVISRAGLLFLAWLVVSHTRPLLPLMLLRGFTILVVTPAVAALLIERAFATTVTVEADGLVLQQDDWRVDIPRTAIAHVDPWTIPLPGSGLWLRLRSGRRFSYGLQLPDPTPFIEALARTGGSAGVETALQHPSVIYARVRGGGRQWRWYHPLLKFVVFALVPTLPLFRLHQYVVFGGTFGEYYLRGLQPYLLDFATHWMVLTIYLVLYNGVWRSVAEVVALAAAWAAPSRAARVRRAAEIGCRVLYYGGVPVLLIGYFLP